MGDFDGDTKSDDLVIVRKMPIYLFGGASNILLLNEDKIMVDRTALVGGVMGGFEVDTQDRDVAVADLNLDGFDDIITAPTRGDPPRVYINDGCAPGCGGPACIGGGNWCGLTHQPTFLDLDTFFCGLDGNGNPIPCGQPFFCGVAAGDLNGDSCPDLYFVDYDKGQTPRLHDRLMINVKEGPVCTGRFVDETIARVRCDQNDCLYESGTGIGVQILDMNDDLCPDILKTQDQKVSVLLNTVVQNVCTGQFDTEQVISEFEDEYMAGAGDFNDDQQPDVFIGTDGQDRFFVNQGSGVFGPPQFPEDSAVSGNVLLEDLDGDLFDDVLLSSIDISIPQFTFPLGFLHTSVDEMDPLIVTIGDRVNGPTGAYDAIPLDIDEDGLLDVWTGTSLGSKLLIQGAASEDCDRDGDPDACEVAAGALDCNGDAVPDQCCIEDMDFDGQVNSVDSGLVQAIFGCTVSPDPCDDCTRADLDGNFQVNPVDLGMVQAAFGICGSMSPFGGGGGDDPPPMMPWQYLRADLSFELRPVGGGDPVRVLAADTDYEVYYTAGHDRVNGFALYGIAIGDDQGIAAATPPARGPWSDTRNDLYVHIKRGEGERVPAYGYDETKFRNDLCANNLFPADPQRYAPPRGTIGSITTRGAGEVDLHLYMYWLDPQEQVLVLMESVKSLVVR